MRNNSFFDDMEYLYASIGMLSVPGALPDLRDFRAVSSSESSRVSSGGTVASVGW